MKKIVIQVTMECEKCRSKALKIAAVTKGVNRVSLEGESRDEVVVTGDDGIDSIWLTNKLRKKLRRHATLISVADVKPQSEEEEEESSEEETTSSTSIPNYYYWNYPPPPCPSYHVAYYHPYPNNNCFIL